MKRWIFVFLFVPIICFGQSTYFAEVIEDTVRRVIVADQFFINSGAVGNPVNWIETSYDTHGGLNPNGTPLRLNYAGIGFTYNITLDGFIPPKIHPSAYIVNTTGLWDFYFLPVLGTWLDAGSAWNYTDGIDTIIVEVVQGHNRTLHDPRMVPALFSTLQFGNPLYWIEGEQVSVDEERFYSINETWYKCIQSHQTQIGWEPPNTPSLWQNITVSPYWQIGFYYSVNEMIIYEPNGLTYKCLQAHTSQAGWTPPAVPALWQQQ